METQRLTAGQVAVAAQLIGEGKLVGIPTETVYGLGANGLDAEAVASIFTAKGRPQDNPLILHIPTADWLPRYCQNIPQTAYHLAEQFWPGPLTMILERTAVVPDCTTAGLNTVGIRCPDHPLTLELLTLADCPVAAPSGNRSGRPSPTTVAHMMEDMEGKIHAILEGGACSVGVESTIIDLTEQPPRLLRPGGVTLEQLRAVLGEVTVDPALLRLMEEGEQPKAPGMKYRHYAPKAPVTVVQGSPLSTAAYIATQSKAGDGVLCFDEYAHLFPEQNVTTLGSATDQAEQARRIFDALRHFDHTEVTAIYAQSPEDTGLGLAVTNRLNKAAGFQIVKTKANLFPILGITGPTGAGKTTALKVLSALGACILDADAVYHQLLAEDAQLKQALVNRFGAICDEIGHIDRKKLAPIVFSDEVALKDLNAISHGFVGREIARCLTQAQGEGKPLAAIDAIALIEGNLASQCQATLAIVAPAELRVKRIMAREGISEDYARQRVEAQKSEDYFRSHCDYTLENGAEDGADSFSKKAKALFLEILAKG